MATSKPRYPLGSPQEHIEMCKTHDSLIDMTCEDCDEFICAKCAKTNHRDHEWSTIPTAATHRRRGLLNFLRKIKEEDLHRIDEKKKKMSKQITENKEVYDSEIKKLQKHFNEIMTRLSEMRENNEQRLGKKLEEKNKKLKRVISELDKKKKEIAETVKFMEDNNSTMSDFGFIDNHRELTQLLSGLDVDINKFKHSVRYYKGEISDEILKNIMGKTSDLNENSLTETSSFQYGDTRMLLLRALCEDQCYIRNVDSDYTEQVTKEGEIKHRYSISPYELYVTHPGDIYCTDADNKSISCLKPSGSLTTINSTEPLEPLGLCQSVDGGLLVTLRDNESDYFVLESQSRRLVRHITITGDVIHDYEYQEDGHTRLFTLPVKVTQNSNSDICVVNRTSNTTGHLVIISSSGHLKSAYCGQNLAEDFYPTCVDCDSLCNILVTDLDNKRIHLLSPDGEFLKFLLTENEANRPIRISLYKSSLWVGYYEGLVKVFQYSLKYT